MKVIRFIGKIVFGAFGLFGMFCALVELSIRKGWIKEKDECDIKVDYCGPWSWLNKFKK